MAKKKPLEAAIQRGLETLARTGLDVDDAGPALVPRLREQWGCEKETDLGVAYVLGKIADRQALEALTAFEKSTQDKAVRKEIRRSLFKLAQKGLTPRESENADAKPATPLFARTPEIEAYLSAVDGGGGRLLWIAKAEPSHGLQVLQGMMNDREGLQRVGGMQIRRKELRRMAQEIKEKHDVTMISVPWEYADQILYEAYEKAKTQARAGLENFHELRGLFNRGKPKEHDHPVYQKADAAAVQEGAWRELSRRLLEEPELRFWILDRDWMEPYLGQLKEAQSSRLVLNPVQKEERLAAIVRDAVKALCSGESGRTWQRRMEDMALYFVETKREQAAKLALAVALQVKEGDPGPLDVSFLTGLVQKSFAVYFSEEKAKAEEEPSLIVKP